jgi:hypothetical protein
MQSSPWRALEAVNPPIVPANAGDESKVGVEGDAVKANSHDARPA